MGKNKYTFWKLLDENSIEIPIIQRDYAQGRAEESRIRDKFLDALYKNIKDEKKPINLDFVYGRIDKNKLIPLDGQQRLTTLFLLHWYLAVNDKKLDLEVIEKLQKFTYETRVSSREFCKALVANEIDLTKKKISEDIEDKNWFFKSWKKDPTVKSMLNMLDAIHKKFKGEEVGLFGKLISDDKPPITFDFLPLNDFNLTDELYIKMNARGKPLTEFENFKANFEKYLTNADDKSKLDNSWTDLFWKYKDGNNIIDDRFLNFFTNITLAFYAEKHELKKGIKIDDISIFDIYETVYNNDDSVINICKLLDVLSNKTNDSNELFVKYIKNDFEVFIGYKEGDTINESESKLSYWDRARFYAIALFLIKNGNSTDENYEQFSNWKRVTFNLINNTLIQRTEDFVKAIKSLKNLSQYANDIHNYLSGDDCKIDFYLQSQVEEEKTKAKLMKESDWREAILNIENHWYFDGQIGFLLELSKDENGQNMFQKFQRYATKCQVIFNKELLDSDEYLVQRALLAQGNYMVELGRNYTFCSSEIALRTKNDNWRKVFGDEEKLEFLKNLLDAINIDNYEDCFRSIIKESSVTDWRKYFIKNKNILAYCSKLQIRMYRIGNKDDYEILLLEKTQVNGYHAEYNTYALYLELNEMKIEGLGYQYQKSENEIKCILINKAEIIWDDEQQKYKEGNIFYSFEDILKKYQKSKK